MCRFRGGLFDSLRECCCVQGYNIESLFPPGMMSQTMFQLNCQTEYFYKAVDHHAVNNMLSYKLMKQSTSFL